MNLRKLLSVVLAVSLVFGLVSTALAESYTPAGAFDAAQRMADLGLVQGREGNDFALSETITRAEMVTVLIRALGQEQTAQLMAGAPAFSDSGSHWASGYIAVAKNLGVTEGRTPTTFEPDAPVTAAEAVAFLVKFLGMPVNDSLGWPNSYLAAALEAGFVTTDDNIANLANSPAPRGMVFFFGDKAFSTVEMENGKTVYQTYVDTDPPAVTVDAVAAVTSATSVTITGKVTGHTVLHVGHSSADWATVATNADGSFSTSVALNPGENNILVHALDGVGNDALKTVTVTRELGAAASIEAAAVTVAAGGEAEVAAAVKDASGAVIEGATVEGESTVGTYADGKFTAGTKAGTGTLTLRSGDAVAEVAVTVTAGALAKVTADKTSAAPGAIVTLTATDEHGNAITSGVTFSEEYAGAVLDGNKFIASTGGNYTVTAKQGDATATVVVGIYGSASALVVKAPETMTANVTAGLDINNNDTYTSGTLYDVTVAVADANGNTVTSEDDISVSLSGAGLAVFDSDKDPVDPDDGIPVKDGVATFKVGVKVGYDGNLIEAAATVTTPGSDIDAGTVEITGAERVATKVVFSGVPKYAPSTSGTDPEIKVQVQDQDGVRIADASFDVTVTVSGPAGIDTLSTKEQTGASDAGEYKFNLVPEYGSSGSITLTATIEGLGSATATTTAAVPGIARGLSLSITDENDKAVTEANANGTSVYTVNISTVDAAGVPTAEGDPDSVKVSFSDTDLDELTMTDTDPLGTDIDEDGDSVLLTDGTGSFTIVANKFTGALPISVSATGLSSASGSLAFKAGDAADVGLTVYNPDPAAADTVKLFVPVTEPTFKLSAQLYDGVGNKVAKAGVKVKFSAYQATADADFANLSTTSDVSFNGTAKSVEVLTDENGVATVNVASRTVTDTSYSIVVDSSAVEPIPAQAAVTFQVRGVVVDKVAVTVKNDVTGNPVTTILDPSDAANLVQIWAKVTDNYGRTVSGAESYLNLKLAEKILWDGVDEFVGDQDDLLLEWVEDGDAPGNYFLSADGTTEAALNVAKAGTQSIVVEYTGAASAIASAPRAVSVRSGDMTTAKIYDSNGNAITSTKVKAKTVAGPYTIRLVDMFGNTVTTGSATSVTVSTSANGGTGTIVVTNANGAALGDLSFRSSQTFYLSASKADELNDYTVTFSPTDSLTDAVLTVTAE